MTDVAATAAPAGEAVIESPSSAPQPLGNQAPTPEKAPETPKAEAKAEPKPEAKPDVAKSAREAVQRAQQALKDKAAQQPTDKAKEAPKAEPAKPEAKTEGKPDTKAEAKPEASRDETGRFATQKQEPAAEKAPSRFEAPQRFNAQAKAAWENADDSVKAETLRAIKELEDGHAKHKASADRYEHLREFDETAKRNGRDLTESLRQIVNFENMMKSNPMAALDLALREAGPRKGDGSPLTINDIVSHVSGQSTDQRLQEAARTIDGLQNKIREMETAQKIPQIVDEFRAGHERFDELTPVIVPLLKAGHSLETAYELAEALKPAQQAAAPLTPAHTALAQTQTPAPKTVNPAGQKSVSGSPVTGSDPANDKSQIPLSETGSVKDALRRAMSRAT